VDKCCGNTFDVCIFCGFDSLSIESVRCRRSIESFGHHSFSIAFLFVLKFKMTFLLNPDLVNMYSLKLKENNEKIDVRTIYDDAENWIIIRYYVLVYFSNFQWNV
jgi:hypothetical protein